MAAAVDWQPLSHRPSMDQYPSSRPSFDRSRSNPSITSTPSYFPPVQQHQPAMAFQQYPQPWTTSALPANAFYQGPGNPYQPFPSPQQQHQAYIQHQFHQSQADFAAWAQAYQHMVMAQVAQHGGGTPPLPAGRRSHEELGAQPRRSHEELGAHARRSHEELARPQTSHSQEELRPTHRRRTSSGPAQSSQQQQAFAPPVGYFEQTLHKQSSFAQSQPQPQPSAPASSNSAPGYHPYKRQPGPRGNRAASNTEKEKTYTQALPSRAVSASATLPAREQANSPEAVIAPPPKVQHPASVRKASFSSDRIAPPPPEGSRHHSPSRSTSSTTREIAAKPSPLSQPPSTQQPTEQMVKSGGLKGRLRRALDKEAKKEVPKAVPSREPAPTSATAPTRVAVPAIAPAPTPAPSTPASSQSSRFTSPQSETSTQSSSPPDTPPSVDTMRPPPSMGALTNHGAMASEVSLADTERTTGPPGGKEKGKGKGLFSMRNPSTDNISLSSTVSSASMMIRRMGALGKLARRNSLMGISRIFKDKPKDGEDGPLPEAPKEDKKSKKERKKAEKAAAKSASAATINRAHAESDRPSDDRALAGLSPAAKLARQHTLRSKAEADAQAASKRAAAAADAKNTGEPTWDHNTTTRNAQQEDGRVTSFGTAGQSIPGGQFEDDEWDGRGPRVYGQEDYDSADSSEGETIDDVTVRMGGVSVADDVDNDPNWGTSYRDRHAKPSRGILKATSSYADLDEPLAAPQAQWNRNRSHSAANTVAQEPGPLAKLPASNPDHIDGIHRSKHDSAYDPYSPSFSPFDSPVDSESLAEKISFPYANPALNTSAPALAMPRKNDLMGKRSQTAPLQKKRLVWAPECAVYNTFASETYDRRSEPATCNRLTPELAQSIKAELNAFKLEMPVHPQSKIHTHFFA